ncbi:pyridoxal phosphate-dependent aminotransferase [Olivibacter sitiensis]|uniref:pyridoxal phosphate-dependent aminotransferase n=1 Tax=Olivibacter sitiensis TaxID=376470 RepID=UPI00040EC809|nr:aminotransferase class I/II-fold pyridoxal phosphate-dependent enzyme [Olivibacter sitiensis]
MQINVAARLQHTQEYFFSKKLREIDALNKAGHQVINLGIGSPDLPPHPRVIETLSHYASLDNSHGYQNYKGIPALRTAIAEWYGRYYKVSLDPETEILPLMGSKEGIMHICMTYLQEGDEALIPNPGYPTYRSAVQLSGATPISYSLNAENDWLPNLAELEKRDLSKVKLMWINYPHMPTGAEANDDFFDQLIAFGLKYNILICHDNPYSFILTERPRSLLSRPFAKECVIELNSLSKSSNMAGWRIGMLSAHADRINEILRFKSNMDSGMFLPLQMAAATALELGPDWYSSLHEIYLLRRQKAEELLNVLHCTYSTKQVGLFLWAHIPDDYANAYELSDHILQQAKVFITPGGIFGSEGDKYIRISLCAKEPIFEQAINRIKDIQ